MGTKPERQLVEVLTTVVDELKDLQAAGRMRDSESRAHVDFLERGLRHAERRLASRESPVEGGEPSGAGSKRRTVS